MSEEDVLLAFTGFTERSSYWCEHHRDVHPLINPSTQETYCTECKAIINWLVIKPDTPATQKRYPKGSLLRSAMIRATTAARIQLLKPS